MANNEKFEKIKNNLTESRNFQIKNLEAAKHSLLEAKNNNETRKIELYSKRIESSLKSIEKIESVLNSMRPNNDDDLENRKNILKTFATLVDENIPDDVPIVFHGNDNISVVEKIIESGGLYTPEERGVDYTSFASQIDVTAKSNIQVSLNFADKGLDSFMPYGAIFVFYPKEHEYNEVLRTGDNSEVFGGVESIPFKEDRFVGVITTDENLDRLKKTMEKNNFDSNKVYTHDKFIEYCKKKYNNIENESFSK